MKETPSFLTEEEEIFNSVQKGDLEKLKDLLKTKLEKNPVIYEFGSGAKSTVLDIAASFGHLNITIWYKDVLGFSDINPKDSKGITPLSLAVVEGHLDVVKYYIQNGYHASSKIFSKYSLQYAFICYRSITLYDFSFN